MEQVDGWLTYRFQGVAAASFVFNDLKGRQSGDLYRDRGGWYTEDGQWHDQRPQAAATTAVPDGSSPQPKSAPPRIKSEDTGLPDFREETIYFLLTARFYDGDPSNNFFCRDRIRFNTAGEAEDPHWRGDLEGLIQRLDYIRDLGFSAIWDHPAHREPLRSRLPRLPRLRLDPDRSAAGIAGRDLSGLHRRRPRSQHQNHPGRSHQPLQPVRHPRQGVDRPLADQILRSPGLGTGPDRPWPLPGQPGNYAWPNRDDIDNPLAPDWYRERHARDPEGIEPLVDPKTGETLPKAGYNPGRFFGIDANTFDPAWYHQEGFICGGDWESAHPLQYKYLAGDCIDLATERENVKGYLIGSIERYLDMGVDALRIDTVKHIERDNLLEYVNAWKAHKPGLFVFGENLVKGYGWGDLGGGDNGPSQIRPWWYTRLGHDPRAPNSGGDSGFPQLDFGLFSTFRDNLSRGSFEGVGRVLEMDWIYGNATELVTFLQNHDVGPDNDFRFRFRGEQWMAAAAYNLLWTVRGIPCLYFGEESSL